ncbi:mechanosensitive ion channel domain-containing protein [Nanoarchaeota archaeon]
MDVNSELVNQTSQFVGWVYNEVYFKIIVALIILLIGFIVGKLVSRTLARLLNEFDIDKILKSSAGIELSIEKLFSSFVAYCIYFIAIIMALNQFNITTTILQMLLGAVLIILIVSAVLAMKDFLPNVFAGLSLYKSRDIKEGDVIKYKDIKGKITEMKLTETRLTTKSGDTIYIPNSVLKKNEIIKVKKK